MMSLPRAPQRPGKGADGKGKGADGKGEGAGNMRYRCRSLP
jgi:hypothetical protein